MQQKHFFASMARGPIMDSNSNSIVTRSNIMSLNSLEVWFLSGSQHLYGEGTLRQVEANSRQVVEGLNASSRAPRRWCFARS